MPTSTQSAPPVNAPVAVSVSTYFLGRQRHATKVIFADGRVVRLGRLVRDRAEAIRLATAERAARGNPVAAPAVEPTPEPDAADADWQDEYRWELGPDDDEDRHYDDLYEDAYACEMVERGLVI